MRIIEPVAPVPSSDVWVLFAIALASARAPADLQSIIKHGDFINHATLGYEELSYGLGRLLERGYITADGLRFALAPAFRETYEAIAARNGTIFGIWDELAEYIGAPPSGEPGADVTAGGRPYDALRPEDVNRALDAYARSWNARP